MPVTSEELHVLSQILWRYLAPKWPLVVGVLVFQLLQALASLYLPSLNADIINNGVAKGDTGYIWATGSWMLLVSFGQILTAIIATWCAGKAAMGAGRDLRRDIFDRVAAFSER